VASRIYPLLVLAMALAPGTWLRTEVEWGVDSPITLTAINEPGAALPEGWSLEGMWEYDSDGLSFGGFSAMLALSDNRLRAFSDRGARFTFVEPDQPQVPYRVGTSMRHPRQTALQLVKPGFANDLWDIESATRDPTTGQYWLGFENVHAFHRFSVGSEAEDVRIFADEVDWPVNSGAEAMVRLQDGRFLVVPESGDEALIYAGDPVAGGEAQRIGVDFPYADFSITEAAQLPDGRLLFLMRKVVWSVPPFEAMIAVAALPALRTSQPLVIRPILDLTAIVPPDNYEAMALREGGSGTVDLWIMSDDNMSVMQRTLLVKFRIDPAEIGAALKAN